MRNKKGITAVVAIVLLLLMTVGAAGLAYLWENSLQNKAQETTGSNVKQMSDESGARIAIDSVWNDTATGNIYFTLRNTGTYTFDTSKIAVYINNSMPSITLWKGGVDVTVSGTLAPKEVMDVHTNEPYPAVGQSKNARVTTEIGSARTTALCKIPSEGMRCYS